MGDLPVIGWAMNEDPSDPSVNMMGPVDVDPIAPSMTVLMRRAQRTGVRRDVFQNMNTDYCSIKNSIP